MLLSLFPVFIAGHALFNGTSVQTVHRGMSVNISCNYKPATDSDDIVELKTNARPVVSVSHVRALGGFPTILCSSEGFYPSALEQLWMRNGEFQNASLTHSTTKTNPDGSFTLHSYLNISDCVTYSCWVNHSSLSQPIILHMSPDCYGNRDNVWIALVTSVLLILTILIITAVCEHSRRAHHRSHVRVNVTPEPDLQSHLQYDIYSLLGDHRPVPCSPVRVRSSPQ
ncbi:HLA class I histocompatibility antigen, Cw-17 alpha chain-like isoform X2 [Sinocyclocheilus anshuiensis]|uniref:HLA class I histocompatibility antigen, Cw-17 alpha chain-like isoform X2 n=1 Tax=Sinocyclocheilus anshuiensis TaxID=1608454 RepID=UPI0007BABF8C|nr:PREDICTED: HLA class I histocompatibility antigen, Cw-17 alpha chain-like isoform X2 [Sinocyclocheilus anshuiensis]